MSSAAMTTLQNTLTKNGHEVKVVYWNIILHSILSKFYNDKIPYDYERKELALFNIMLATEMKDNDIIENYKFMFMSAHPNIPYLNIDPSKYIKQLSNKSLTN